MPEISFSCDLDTSEQALYRLLRFFTKIRAHLRRCSSFAQKVTLGSPARLQAPSRRLAAATNLLRVRGFNPSTENTSELSPLCASSPTTTRCAGLAVGFLVTTLGIFFVNASLVGASFVSLAPIFYKNQSALTPLLLLCAKGHARLACSVASALATARCRYQPFAGSRVQIHPTKTKIYHFVGS